MREYVEVPAGTATLVIEPMLDSASGRLSIDNVAVDSVEHVAIASPALQPTGEVELKWTFAGLSGTPASYDIHRSTDAGFEPSDDTLVRSVPAITMAEDATTQPGTTYHYRVVAKDAAGALLATTDAAAATTPATFVDRQLKDVLTATAEGDGVRVAWRVAAGTAETYTLYSGPATLASGSLKSAKRIGPATVETGATGLSGALTLPGSAPAAYALVNAAGEVVASAKVADLAHPRLWIDDDKLAKVREQIAVPGEPQEIWNGILARVAGGLTATPDPYGQGFGEGDGRYAVEAALAYQVTGDASYAQKAYDGIVAAEAKLPLGTRQPLEDANPAPVLAQAYDWACKRLDRRAAREREPHPRPPGRGHGGRAPLQHGRRHARLELDRRHARRRARAAPRDARRRLVRRGRDAHPDARERGRAAPRRGLHRHGLDAGGPVVHQLHAPDRAARHLRRAGRRHHGARRLDRAAAVHEPVPAQPREHPQPQAPAVGRDVDAGTLPPRA
ncbi:hypothetical protein [Microbacterium sp. Root53]|uniref:hypothetical protein n=1 Tax=Microbacterium sp. Root53 TaxID=1736553 RepID=UPI0012E3E362|nr:hypothetical protein [Microbacterium sp. Root53]